MVDKPELMARDRASDNVRETCVWARTHKGTTCIETTAGSWAWCVVCKGAYEAETLPKGEG